MRGLGEALSPLMQWGDNGGCLFERHHGDRQHVLLEEQSLLAYMAYISEIETKLAILPNSITITTTQ